MKIILAGLTKVLEKHSSIPELYASYPNRVLKQNISYDRNLTPNNYQMTNIERSNFKRLVGVWKTSGQITTENGKVELKGIDTYELILDGNYILHKADVNMGNEKSETFEIISLDDAIDKVKMQYFNSKGESGTMTSEIINNDYRINGDGIKFSGTINDNNSELIGKWFLQAEDKSWTEFINLKLEKQN